MLGCHSEQLTVGKSLLATPPPTDPTDSTPRYPQSPPAATPHLNQRQRARGRVNDILAVFSCTSASPLQFTLQKNSPKAKVFKLMVWKSPRALSFSHTANCFICQGVAVTVRIHNVCTASRSKVGLERSQNTCISLNPKPPRGVFKPQVWRPWSLSPQFLGTAWSPHRGRKWHCRTKTEHKGSNWANTTALT